MNETVIHDFSKPIGTKDWEIEYIQKERLASEVEDAWSAGNDLAWQFSHFIHNDRHVAIMLTQQIDQGSPEPADGPWSIERCGRPKIFS